MKVAVTGKGGVGKTTVAAALAHCWRDTGCRVIAIDADPDANLGGTLGYIGNDIEPLVRMKRLIEERVGDSWSGFLKMNPRVDDIPERFGVEIEGILLLVVGKIEHGGTGCTCPANVFLREVLNHLLLVERERVVVDMEAGLEHLGRGTVEGVDLLLVVVEPGWASTQTASRTMRLAGDLGITRVKVVANKIAKAADLAFIRESLPDAAVLGSLPFDRSIEQDVRNFRVERNGPFRLKMQQVADLLGR